MDAQADKNAETDKDSASDDRTDRNTDTKTDEDPASDDRTDRDEDA